MEAPIRPSSASKPGESPGASASPLDAPRWNSTRAFALLCALAIHLVAFVVFSYVQFGGGGGGEDVVLRVDVSKLLPARAPTRPPQPVQTQPKPPAASGEAEPLEPKPLEPEPAADAAALPPSAALDAASGPAKATLGDVGGDKFMGFIQNLRARGMDVVFVFDSTSSMKDVLDQVKADVRRMVAVLHALVPECRLGVVTYRDKGSEYVTRRIRLTDDRDAVMRFVSRIEAGVGRNAEGVEDWPEQVRQGLADAIHSRWRPGARKAIILIGDAPPPDEEVEDALALAAEFRRRERGVVHTIYVATVNADNMTGQALAGQQAEEASARALLYSQEIRGFFERLARAGGGEALQLRRGQEVVRHLLTLAFGVEWSGDIQKIYDRAGVK